MKKTTFYKIGALSLALLGAGVFTSFDDAMTDEQKVEAAYNQMVTDYKAEQTELCKTQALEMAQKEWTRMQAEMAGSGSGDAPTYSGSSKTRNMSSSSSSNTGSEKPTTTTGGNVDNTPPPPPKEDPNSAGTKVGAVKKGDNTNAGTKVGAVKKGDNTDGSSTNVGTKVGAVKKK